MSTCPICGVMTTDPAGMGGVGTGPLPESVQELDRDVYDVYADETTLDDGKVVGHTYSVQCKHVKCEICAMMEQMAHRNPDRMRKIVHFCTTAVAIEAHADVWQELADM